MVEDNNTYKTILNLEKNMNITSNNFQEEVINSKIPVLVDFYADWCAPCRFLAPIIEEVTNQYKDKIKVCKVNVDDEASLASKYSISSIPTLIFFKDGVPKNTAIGAISKAKLEAYIQELL
jgi:thioredoxin 1